MSNLILVITLLSCVTALVAESTFPLFMWSNGRFFNEGSQYVTESVSTSDIARLISGHKMIEVSHEITATPDVSVIFLLPGLNTNDFVTYGESNFKKLKGCISNSYGSIVMPYVYGDSLISQIVDQSISSDMLLIGDQELNGILPAFGLKNILELDMGKMVSFMKSSRSVTKPSLVVIDLSQDLEVIESIHESDDLISTITEKLGKEYGDTFVSIVIPLNTRKVRDKTILQSNKNSNFIMEEDGRILLDEDTVPIATTTGIYLTPALFTSLLTALMIIFFVFSGMSALMSIQSNPGFEKPSPPIGSEN